MKKLFLLVYLCSFVVGDIMALEPTKKSRAARVEMGDSRGAGENAAPNVAAAGVAGAAAVVDSGEYIMVSRPPRPAREVAAAALLPRIGAAGMVGRRMSPAPGSLRDLQENLEARVNELEDKIDTLEDKIDSLRESLARTVRDEDVIG